MQQRSLVFGVLAATLLVGGAHAEDRLQFGTAWTEVPRLARGLPAAERGTDESGRIVYYTPRLVTPRLVTPRPGLDVASRSEAIGTGYLQSLGPVGLALFAEHGADATPEGSERSDTWSGGLQLTYEGFGIGGSLLRSTDVAGSLGTTRDAYELAGSYNAGRLTIGLSYQRVMDSSGLRLGLTGTGAEEDPGHYYSLGVTYELLPGLTLGGGLQLYDDPSTATGPALPGPSDGPRTILMLGTAIEF